MHIDKMIVGLTNYYKVKDREGRDDNEDRITYNHDYQNAALHAILSVETLKKFYSVLPAS